MTDWRERLSDAERGRLRKSRPDPTPEAMLATLSHEVFSSDAWLYERKLDGERVLAVRDGEGVRLVSRNGKALNHTYPELVEALERSGRERFVIDGEVVAFAGNVTSFVRLQKRMQIKDPEEARCSGVAVHLYLFDVLNLDGWDTTRLPLRRRKALLRDAFRFRDPLRYAAHRNTDGAAYHREACAKGWEGLIAKRADAPYTHGRSRDWLKLKCVNEQELVIGGWTEPRGSRTGFGALLVGYYQDGELRYAGMVGTGFDEDMLDRLSRSLRQRERKTPPFARDDELPAKGVHWAAPELVGEVGFTEWTGAGKLRHPRFLGLRRDKDPQDVVREDQGR